MTSKALRNDEQVGNRWIDRDELARGQKDEAGMKGTGRAAGTRKQGNYGDSGSSSRNDGSQGNDGPGGGKLERLQKILAAAGVASRRKAEEIILAGRVQVNGTVVAELGTKHDPEPRPHPGGWEAAEGAGVAGYYMLNKPRGYVTTLDDPQKRPTVMDLMTKPKAGPHGGQVRLYPVGRLDYLSEGLLLMTNDGESGESAVEGGGGGGEDLPGEGERGSCGESGLEQIRRGIVIDRGRLDEVRAGSRDRIVTAPAKVELVRGGDNPWYEVTLTRGGTGSCARCLRRLGTMWKRFGGSGTERCGWMCRRASFAS